MTRRGVQELVEPDVGGLWLSRSGTFHFRVRPLTGLRLDFNTARPGVGTIGCLEIWLPLSTLDKLDCGLENACEPE
jgi:hypothetical protein